MRPWVALALLSFGLAACNENTAPGNDRAAQVDPVPMPAEVVPATEALSGIATEATKLGTMSDAEVAVLGGYAGRCVFRVTEVAFPSFYFEPDEAGAVKLNGKLIPLPAKSEGVYAADGLQVRLKLLEGEGDALLQAAEMLLILPKGAQESGYRGYIQCFDAEGETA